MQAHTPCLLHIRDFLRFGLESVWLWAGLIKQSWAVGNYWFIQCCQSDSLQNIFSLTSQKPTGTGLVLVNYSITWQGLGHHWIPRRQAEKENVICRLGGSKLALWHLQSSRWGLASHWPSSARPDPGQSCGWCWAQEERMRLHPSPHLICSSDTWQPHSQQRYKPVIDLSLAWEIFRNI